MKFRAPVFEDAPAVLAVLVARDIADLGARDYTLEDLLDAWRATEFDLVADALVAVTDDARIVGYAASTRPGTYAVVDPDHEGRGIGTRLLDWAERRDRELGRKRHRQGLPASNERGRARVVAAGYEPSRSYWRLTCQLDELHETDEVPTDFSLRSLDADSDAKAVHALNEASFAGHADYRPETFISFRDEHLRAHDLDAILSCLAEHDGDLVGFLLARRWREENVGFVDLLGVHRDHIRRGLATMILKTTFVRFAAAGLREAQLGVASDNPRALILYERCGMTPRFTIDTYERPARSDTPA
ncbi:MAG: GNAT family N-acetyltransferase [Solirubrobacteraceae bacterium]